MKSLLGISIQIIFYAVTLIYLYFWLIWNVGLKIDEKCKGYWGCSRFLKSSGYGYSVDLSDGQWRDFRNSLGLLCKSIIGISILYQILKLIYKSSGKSFPIIHTAHFRIIVGLIILYVQHGMHALIIITIALFGYNIARFFPSVKVLHPALTWIFAVFILFSKESYRIKSLPGFQFLIPLFDKRYGGMYGWQLPANYLVLRMVSYSLDFHWWTLKQKQTQIDANNVECKEIKHSVVDSPDSKKVGVVGATSMRKNKSGSPTNKTVTFHDETLHAAHHNHPNITDEESKSSGGKCPFSSLTSAIKSGSSESSTNSQTTTTVLTEDDYDFTLYMSYMLYSPLYMAGPIITYDDYIHYTKFPQQTENVLYYAMRWLACFALMEFLTNHFPFFAVVQSGLLPYLSIGEIAVVFYMILKLMWLKFLLIWRFFRLWALVDGILPPENMTKCMSNNKSLEGFWKGWHASYNKWLVRYIYKPCGGRHSRVWSVWIIFLFVALWHDIEVKLVLWGLLNAFFLVVEIYAKHLAATSSTLQSLPSSIFHMVIVLSGSTYILVLISVNLIGYSVGMGSITLVMNKMLTREGFQVLLASYFFLSVGVKLMMFIEDTQKGKFSKAEENVVQKE